MLCYRNPCNLVYLVTVASVIGGVVKHRSGGVSPGKGTLLLHRAQGYIALNRKVNITSDAETDYLVMN